MKNKKSQGMPLSVIVVAALVLLVLVILAVIFIGKMGSGAQTLNSCTDNGGYCVLQGICGMSADQNGGIRLPQYACEGEGLDCCTKE